MTKAEAKENAIAKYKMAREYAYNKSWFDYATEIGDTEKANHYGSVIMGMEKVFEIMGYEYSWDKFSHFAWVDGASCFCV